MEMQALITSQGNNLDALIAAWLHEKEGLSGSKKTRRAYEDTLRRFRLDIQAQGLDLFSAPSVVSVAAQVWAGKAWLDGRDVTNGTYNLRLAALSSFFAYVRTKDASIVNPIAQVKRRSTQEYAGAEAIDEDIVREALLSINRATLAGLRDYGLLVVGLVTGRRASEIASLRLGDLQLTKKGLVLHFTRCKGGKTMTDRLDAGAADAVLSWLHRLYGESWAHLPAETPLWTSLSNHDRGQPLTIQSISRICERHLGTSKIHALRHSFAHAMDASGAALSDIAGRLGHNNTNITARYLKALKREENPYAGKLAARWGISHVVDCAG